MLAVVRTTKTSELATTTSAFVIAYVIVFGNEFNTSKLCCDCSQELKHYKDKKNTDVYRLFCCVSCKNKETVFRTRDANSAVNMRKLTRSWMETQTRPSEFSRKQCLSPVLEKTGKSKTIVVTTT